MTMSVSLLPCPSLSSSMATAFLRSTRMSSGGVGIASSASASIAACIGSCNISLQQSSSQRRRYYNHCRSSSSSALVAHRIRSLSSTMIHNHNHYFLSNNNNHQQTRQFARSTKHRPKRGTKGFDKYDLTEGTKIASSSSKDDKNILVIGSSGVLGSTLTKHLGGHRRWNVVGADILDPNEAMACDGYVHLPSSASLADLTTSLYRGVSSTLHTEQTSKENKLDAIIVAAGGWAGDVDIAEMMEKHYAEVEGSELEDVDVEEEYARESAAVCERMMRLNYWPIVAGGVVGQRFMKRGGLFVIIGASAALSPTPGMLGYGSSKSAAHHFLQSYGPPAHEQNDTTAVGILPLMIDTPANRAMLGAAEDGDGDERFSKMVHPRHIANEIGEWIEHPHLRPHSGSLVKVIAKNRRDGSGGAAFHLVR